VEKAASPAPFVSIFTASDVRAEHIRQTDRYPAHNLCRRRRMRNLRPASIDEQIRGISARLTRIDRTLLYQAMIQPSYDSKLSKWTDQGVRFIDQTESCPPKKPTSPARLMHRLPMSSATWWYAERPPLAWPQPWDCAWRQGF